MKLLFFLSYFSDFVYSFGCAQLSPSNVTNAPHSNLRVSSNRLIHFNVVDGISSVIQLPVDVAGVKVLDVDKWLITEHGNNNAFVTFVAFKFSWTQIVFLQNCSCLLYFVEILPKSTFNNALNFYS